MFTLANRILFVKWMRLVWNIRQLLANKINKDSCKVKLHGKFRFLHKSFNIIIHCHWTFSESQTPYLGLRTFWLREHVKILKFENTLCNTSFYCCAKLIFNLSYVNCIYSHKWDKVYVSVYNFFQYFISISFYVLIH